MPVERIDVWGMLEAWSDRTFWGVARSVCPANYSANMGEESRVDWATWAWVVVEEIMGTRRSGIPKEWLRARSLGQYDHADALMNANKRLITDLLNDVEAAARERPYRVTLDEPAKVAVSM